MIDDKTPQRPDGLAGDEPNAASHSEPTVETTVMPAMHTETRTVVKTKSRKLPIFLASLLGLAVGSVLVIALVMSGAFRITGTNVESAVSGATQTIEIDPEDTTLSEAVAAKALPSVVSITAQGETEDSGGIGSGVILDTDGNILTNYHVIEGASALVVRTDSGDSYEAEVVGADESSDLAVIRLQDAEDADLTPIELADSDDLTVGEWVMAIGSPFGNEQSVSTGIVSALYRSTALQSTSGTSIYANMIQTDAAINPGNSGGALVNDEGKLIGINSVIESYSGSSSGVGFAIPVNYAINIANQIIAGETPVHPYLGASLMSVNAYNARQNNLAVDSGAYVAEVTADGPAATAGIEAGDIVTAVDGEPISSADGLIIALREHEVGDKVTLTVMRGKDEKEIEVELGSDEALQAEQQDASDGNGSSGGMTEEEFLRYLEQYMGGRGGF
ncbi:trypsin-like peptidase domain-containing protein [uncultured Collinsella sp.]|uniref:S1C family serine protease n=1 Tax=uncultured Collinsella sp. TaxID=165190 RepID=UPI0025DE49D9|nr:trypsin-like peptidase domain-containing protein [uncultured Collinsella sp.]